ncbi:Ig-like domain-containing protein [Cellulophaga sp. Hel_I_12]|uniref:Ig-like domain-containing protein n=1 Tax=Cellulophaga sp. Hel_I_12 TaxID=1249972 RepID=UPI0006465ABB|nr:Ig-like domain-containing protein [Cellulophaga sp. Hel_I_12]
MKKYTTSLLLAFLFGFLFSCSSDSENKEVPDIVAPDLAFSIAGFPKSNTSPIIVSKSFEININAKDEGGISKIEAFINNEKVGEDSTAPYLINIDVSTFTSKIANSQKYKDYVLKVTATDKNENSTSTEQIIYIDNEIPTISAVSILENSILNGDLNEVSFTVTDNQEVVAITAFLNETELPIVEGDTLKINISTLNLTDGPNTLKIEAIDNAKNTTSYTVNFISDNTGPEIKLNSLIEGQIIDEAITLNPIITDAYSEIDSLRISINDSIIFKGLYANEINYNLDPENFAIGENVLNIEVNDNLDNKTTYSIRLMIHRRLLKITLENGTINPSYAKFYVFASDTNGELLDIKEATISSTELILNTAADIDKTAEFMITFAGFSSGYADFSTLSTIQNITRDNLKLINLKTPKRESVVNNKHYKVINNQNDIEINGYGSFYNSSYFPENDSLHVETRELINSNIVHSDKIYLKSNNYNNNVYSYLLLDAPLPDDNFIIDYSKFISDGVEKRFYDAPFTMSDNGKSTILTLFGYLNEADFNQESGHLLWNQGKALSSNFNPSNGILYSLDTQFTYYRYELQLEDYFTKRIGTPLPYYSYPNWSIDFIQNGNNIQINSTGMEHTNGSIFLENSDGINDIYRWNIIFNSQTTSTVILPKIPNELNSWNISQSYNTNNLDVQQVALKRYEGINSYEAYLIHSIKPNLSSRKTTDFMETIFKNPTYNVYRDIEDLFIIY